MTVGTLAPYTPPQLPAAIERLRAYGHVMLDTLDQLLDSDPASPYVLCFRDWAIFGGRYLGFWLDEQRLYHLSLDQLASKKITDRLALSVRKPVFVVHDPSLGFLYVVQLRPRDAAPEPPAVTLPRLVRLDLSQKPARPFSVPFGVTASGPQQIDLAQPNHILIAGVTQSGKSSWMQAALLTLAAFNAPDQVRIVIVDPKGEFVHWRAAPHLFAPIARDEQAAMRVLTLLNDEMERRRDLFEAATARNLTQYNLRARSPLPYLVVCVDEFVELSVLIGRAFLPLLMRIASKAASYGIRLMLAATSPKSEIVDSTLRQQCGIRIAFRCTEVWQSEAVLGQGRRDAARLPNIAGRFVAQLPGASVLVEAQAYYVDDDLLAETTQQIKARHVSPPISTGGVGGEPHLSDLEREMVLYALNHLDGYFKLRELGAQFKGRLTLPALRDLAGQWEKRGWLLPPASVTSSRQIARVLHDLVGWVSGEKP